MRSSAVHVNHVAAARLGALVRSHQVNRSRLDKANIVPSQRLRLAVPTSKGPRSPEGSRQQTRTLEQLEHVCLCPPGIDQMPIPPAPTRINSTERPNQGS